MTDTRRKARAMLNDARDAHVNPDDYLVGYTALCRAIEQHEAFRQEVSEAVVEYFGPKHLDVILAGHRLNRFIIPKPDQLVDVVKDVTWYDNEITAKELRAALEARGLEIREKGQ